MTDKKWISIEQRPSREERFGNICDKWVLLRGKTFPNLTFAGKITDQGLELCTPEKCLIDQCPNCDNKRYLKKEDITHWAEST